MSLPAGEGRAEAAIRALREENDLLRARVSELQHALRPYNRQALEWGLGPSHTGMFATLAARSAASYEALALAGVGPTDGIRSPETVKTQIARLRKRIAPYGYRIEPVWGFGYRLVPPKAATETTDVCVAALRCAGTALRRAAQ
ncbi:MAG: hypothetical protein V7704_20740 [Aurantimonas endophytica]|uniref:hypothetical protein n=1 Tax=Aurantimonas endophytica TaxID=1522175 RepID=UPI0030034E8B